MTHPDNTLRALKDEPLFVERWQCRVGFHRWTKWSKAEKSPSELYFRQTRHCVECNRAQAIKVQVPL